ncbi:MAG: response regulator [Flavobacteriaceae bacterium]|nr:response regulator [Flavobacteriaceae bacterium]
MESGIAKIEYPSPFSFFNKHNNTPDLIFDIHRFRNKLFVGGNGGLFYLEGASQSGNSSIKPVSGNFGSVRDMLLFKDRLLIGSGNGLHEIDEYGKHKKLFPLVIQTLYRSKVDSNRVFVGTSSGVVSIYHKKGIWAHELFIDVGNNVVSKMVEDTVGQLWVGIDKNELIRVSINYQKKISPTVKTFTPADGLPNNVVKPYMIDNRLYIKSGDEVFIFNSTTDRFSKDDNLFKKLGLENNRVKINSVDDQGNIWLIEYDGDNRLDQLVAFFQKDGKYKLKRLNEKRIIDRRRSTTYPELNDSIVWYRGKPGIVRHDLKKKHNKNTVISKTIVSSVLWQNDSLIFGGYGSSIIPKLSFKYNQLRFQFASPSFYDESENQFQYKLEGFDKDWSLWTSETKKDYTNIPEGDYSFKVRSKNVFNQISKEDSYFFTILPPWYRTWWMYFLYGFGAIGVVILITQWRSNQLYKKNVILEAAIKDRTSEIVKKNLQLKNQTEQLKVVDKMKTRLFANISHEFRTPLTLIKGPIEQLEQHPEKKLSISNVKMIRRNANRLLKLVNQLLDLSKLESGNLELESSEGNVYKCLRAVASSFSSHAAQRNMDYQINIPSKKILWASFDRDKLDKIIYNLLSNAFKFTDDEGIVKILVKFSKEQLKIEVVDSGCGIPSDRLPFVFDRFFQVDDSFTKEKEGTGIGLSLTKELVELMKGTIHVESEYKRGSVFKIMIPLEEIKTVQKEDEEEFNIKINKEEASITIKPQNKNLHTILIVEDNKDMRDFIKQQLEDEYQIIEAYNGQDGLEKASKIMPDLIITDLMMPKMDGITLCKQLKKEINTSHIPVIMLTAKAGVENKIEGLETGADDYLTKPFNSKELHARIKNLIEQRQKLRELFSKKDIIHPKEVTVTSLDEQFLQKIINLL